MRKRIIAFITNLFLLLLFISTLVLVGCDNEVPPEDDLKNELPDDDSNKDLDGDEPKDEVKNVNTHEEYNILEGTIYETTVHIFKSNIAGPKVAIVGGIHGDEIAGWSTALNLLEKKDFCGEVMVIPQANILADELQLRYPGNGSGNVYNGITYSDLNRSFPGKENGTPTQRIAYAISQELIKFAPEYAIDLHESRRSSTDINPLLGDLIIYGNRKSSLIAGDMTYEFNSLYKLPGEVDFGIDANAPDGTFNGYCGEVLNVYAFTFETNRQLSLSRRIEQQTQLLNIFFEYIWK